MAHALPLTKLASLLVKTLAKPLSKRIKHEFSRYNFTKQMLMSIGQTTHSLLSRMQIWSAGYRVRSIKPLEEDKALQDGAEFVGESFVFIVSGTLVVWEYTRSAESARQKDEEKRAQAKAERALLQAKLIALDARLKAVEATVKHNSQSILGLRGSHHYVEPSAEKLVNIEDDDDDDERVEHPSQPKHSSADMPQNPTSTASGSTQNAKPWWKIW